MVLNILRKSVFVLWLFALAQIAFAQGRVNPRDLRQAGATTGQVLAWNGTIWAPTDPAAGSGTVTSVGFTTTSTHFSVTGSPITTSGTIDLAWVSQSANVVLGGPASGGAVAPTFRSLVDNDIPDTITLTNITQITTRSHTSLTDIGTNTHATIDTHIAATTAHSATALNTADRIVLRDGSGNFAAGTITAALTGIASGNALTTLTLTAGAGISGGGDLSANRSFATASGETDFLASGALTCGATTQGKMQVHTTPLQYCDNAATPALQYAAYGTSAGASLTGDSATAFFTTGQIEAARGGTGVDSSGSTGVARAAAGAWTFNAGVSHLAASTSADLAGVLSDETGTSGGFARAGSPTLSGTVTIDRRLEFTEATGDPACTAGDFWISVTSTTNVLRKCQNGTLTDLDTGGGGDSILVNGVAAVDPDLSDTTPAAPAGSMNIKWQKNADSPNNRVSAYIPVTVLLATSFSGSDIGAQVNAAFTSLGAGCGTVRIPPGNYTFSTTIYVRTGCILEGSGRGNETGPFGTKLLYDGAAATSAIIIMEPAMTRADWASVRDLSIYTNAAECGSGGMLRWNPDAGGANKWNCAAFGTKVTVTAATNAAPIQVTAATHGLITGDRAWFQLIGGNLTANNEYKVTKIDNDNVTLDSSTGVAAYTSGGTLQKITYSAAVPHLAAIQHGQIDPTVLADGTHITMSNIDVNGGGQNGDNTQQGGFHIGVYLNGCEECVVQSVYVKNADDGFYLGTAANGVLLLQATARVNKRSGIHARGSNGVTCIECLLESNNWSDGTDDLDQHGAGLRLSSENLATGASQGWFGLRTYYEGNTVDVVGMRGVGATIQAPRAYSLEGFLTIRGIFGGGGGATMDSCTIPDASLVTLVGNSDSIETGCTVTGAFVSAGSGYQLKYSDGRSLRKLNRLEGSTRIDQFEIATDAPGNPGSFFWRGIDAVTLFGMENPVAATSSINTDTPRIRFKAFRWTGSSVPYYWNIVAMSQLGNGPAEAISGLYFYVADAMGTKENRRFAFRDDTEFRLLNATTAKITSGTDGENALQLMASPFTFTGQTAGTPLPTRVIVKATGGQSTTNLQEWQGSGGAVLLSVRPDGSTDWTEIAAPASPAASTVRVYAKTGSGELCSKSSGGVETCMSAGSGGSAHNLLSSTHSDTAVSAATLGDMIVGNSTPAWAELAGSISATKKFLSQTGNGSISALPVWDDVAFTNVTGTATKSQIPATVAYEDEANIFTVAGGLTLDNQLGLRMREATATGTEYVEFRAASAITTSYTLTFPAADAAGFFRTNGSGTVSFAAASGTGACTNQFARTLNDNAAPTCATVGAADTDETTFTGVTWGANADFTWTFDTVTAGASNIVASFTGTNLNISTGGLQVGGTAVVVTSRAINTTSPYLTGGGDLSADRTLTLAYSATLAGNPALNADECVFSTDGTGGGIICEGAADTIEGLLVWNPTTTDRTLTLPDASDTLVGRDTTDTLTGKTYDADAGTGNVLTISTFIEYIAAICQASTASLGFSTPSTNAPTATCVAAANAGDVTTTTTATTYGTASFAENGTAAASQSVQGRFRLPADWTGVIDLDGTWRGSQTTGDVLFRVATACVADAETGVPTWNAAQSFTADTAKGTTLQWNNLATLTSVTTTGCAADEYFMFRFWRDATQGGDTLTGAAELISIRWKLRRAI